MILPIWWLGLFLVGAESVWSTLLIVQSMMCVPCHMCCSDPILLSMQLTFWNARLDVFGF